MVRFTQTDFKLILASLLCVILLSFAFSSAGYADEDIQTDEIPELEIDDNTLSLVADIPHRPNTPTSGILYYDEDSVVEDSQLTLDREASGGDTILHHQLEAFTINNDDEVIRVNLQDIQADHNADTSHLKYDEVEISPNEIGKRTNLQIDEEAEDGTITVYLITVELNRASVEDGNINSFEIEYDVIEEKDSDGMLNRIPVVGGVLDSTANQIGWIGAVILWGILFVVEFFVNIAIIGTLIFLFLFGLLSFILTNYLAVVSGAGGVASLVILFPSLLLSLLIAKLTILIINTIWLG